MPLFEAPEGNSDGGYAVSSYRARGAQAGDHGGARRAGRRAAPERDQPGPRLRLQPHLQRARVGAQGRRGRAGVRGLLLDLPGPHGAGRVRAHHAGDLPGRPPRLLHVAGCRGRTPGGCGATFYSFQWDLNYANPAVFRAMAAEMLFLANQGVEMLRMDAVAFIWKQLGTACENLPEAHVLLRAYNALCRIAAPAAAVQVRGDRPPGRGRPVHRARTSASCPTTRSRWP